MQKRGQSFKSKFLSEVQNFWISKDKDLEPLVLNDLRNNSKFLAWAKLALLKPLEIGLVMIFGAQMDLIV